ncbi:MAG: hypothetical protein K2K04_00730 [Clostridia bacterium]|nr:hypothetical protein [Clostridia bacterium]
MKFLFFDLEYAHTLNGGRGVICEFGYVLTDEKFEVLKQDVLLINPEWEFDKYVLDNMLAFKREDYEAAPDFAARYKEIKALLEGDVTVVGHTVDGDAHSLNHAAKRYELPYINFDFYDLKQIYKHRKKVKQGVGLESILKALQLDFGGHVHESDADAYATMLAVKELCRLSEMDAAAFIAEYVPFKGNTTDGQVTQAKMPPIVLTEEEKAALEAEKKARREKKEAKRREAAERAAKLHAALEEFAVTNTVEQNNFGYLEKLAGGSFKGRITKSRLTGKKICIDRDYQKMHFKEILSLIWLIKRSGGRCLFYPTHCNIFINAAPDDYPKKHANYLRVAESKNAEILTLEELLGILNVTAEDLYKMPFPPAGAFSVKKSGKKGRRKK